MVFSPADLWIIGGKGGSTALKTGERPSRRGDFGVENLRNHKILRHLYTMATRYSGQAPKPA